MFSVLRLNRLAESLGETEKIEQSFDPWLPVDPLDDHGLHLRVHTTQRGLLVEKVARMGDMRLRAELAALESHIATHREYWRLRGLHGE